MHIWCFGNIRFYRQHVTAGWHYRLLRSYYDYITSPLYTIFFFYRLHNIQDVLTLYILYLLLIVLYVCSRFCLIYICLETNKTIIRSHNSKRRLYLFLHSVNILSKVLIVPNDLPAIFSQTPFPWLFPGRGPVWTIDIPISKMLSDHNLMFYKTSKTLACRWPHNHDTCLNLSFPLLRISNTHP